VSVSDRLETIRTGVAPVIAPLGLEVYDVVLGGGVLRLLVERPGGVDVDTLEEASRLVGPLVDDLVSGSYTLEVSSPGLERPLRRPEHYAGAIGSEVSVKARDEAGAMQRHRGTLVAVDDAGITIRTDAGDEHTLRFDTIESARTVFEWAPAPKPGKGSKPGRAKKEAAV
jgi:ribosome maturation factor RimP